MAVTRAKKSALLPRLNVLDLQESTLLILASDPNTPPGVLDQIGRLALDRPAIVEKLAENLSTPEDTLVLIEGNEQFRPWIDARRGKTGERDEDEEEEAHSVFARIQKMNVAEKIRLALKGGREARVLLIKEPNKQVSRSVLANPKITDNEIERIAQSTSVSDEVLRLISVNRTWMRNYAVMLSLANNPRTPIGVSLALLKNIKTRDLGGLSKSRSVSEALRSAATKMYQLRQRQGR